MKNQKSFTEEEIAKDEPSVTEEELLAEIMPLLEDYFVGEIFLQKQGITYHLPNGQNFILKAKLAV